MVGFASLGLTSIAPDVTVALHGVTIKQLFDVSPGFLSVPCGTTRTVVRSNCYSISPGGEIEEVDVSVPVQSHGADGVHGLRLTRRGRAVVVSLVTGLALASLWVTAKQGSTAAPADATPVPVADSRQWVKVGEGDILWSIAERSHPGADPRVVVHRIMRVNDLPDPIVHPGQRLWLPGH
jgi:hypothetical protein